MKKIAIVCASLLLTSSAFAKITDYNTYISRSQTLTQKLEELSQREKASDEYSYCGLFLWALQHEIENFHQDLIEIGKISDSFSVVFHNNTDAGEQEIIDEARADLYDGGKMIVYLQRSQCQNPTEAQNLINEVEAIKQDFLANA